MTKVDDILTEFRKGTPLNRIIAKYGDGGPLHRATMFKPRPIIGRAVIEEMMQKCNYSCPVCHNKFYTEQKIENVLGDAQGYRIILLCPDCAKEKEKVTAFSLKAYELERKTYQTSSSPRKTTCPRCNLPYFEIHHIDRDYTNNRIDNLVPLCLTHLRVVASERIEEGH